MDRSLCISWYNLQPNSREAYLRWLHGSFIQKLAKRPGVLWAAHYEVQKYDIPTRVRHTSDLSLPKGNDYVLIVGAPSSHVFSRPLDSFVNGRTDTIDSDVSAEDRSMLALRSDERTSIMTEEARIDGPKIKTRSNDGGPALCIQLGSLNANNQAAEEELLSWYARWRMPALGKLNGCVALRKLVSVTGWAKHGVIYEFTSRDVRNIAMKEMGSLYPDMTE